MTGGAALAQTEPAVSQKDTTQPSTRIEAINQYKASSTTLLALQEEEIAKAEAKLEELRKLVADGLVAKVEVEEEEQRVLALRSQKETTQKQIVDSDSLVAEVKVQQELEKSQAAKPVKLVSKSYGALNQTGLILRNSGFTFWSLGHLQEVQTFFSSQFGHALPTSAVGQSATHNRLGYNHRNAVDVALNPDSVEGKGLINYLQVQGIPFLAFRGAIAGVATGPHIHIGLPSHRL